jgi:hypothetical protein
MFGISSDVDSRNESKPREQTRPQEKGHSGWNGYQGNFDQVQCFWKHSTSNNSSEHRKPKMWPQIASRNHCWMHGRWTVSNQQLRWWKVD